MPLFLVLSFKLLFSYSATQPQVWNENVQLSIAASAFLHAFYQLRQIDRLIR